MKTAVFSIKSSLDCPPLAFSLGYIESKVFKSSKVSFYALVISAFSCKPKASGSGFKGKDSIYSKYSALVPAFGYL
jgi:hypothetical protein